MPSPAAGLAALRDGRTYSHRGDRLLTRRLDDGRTLEYPGPRLLARVFVLPLIEDDACAFRLGGRLAVRAAGSDAPPAPIDLAATQARVLAELEALPALSADAAGRPYDDVRSFALSGDPGAVAAYVAEALDAARVLAPEWRPSREPKRTAERPALTNAEWKAADRARRTVERAITARAWLCHWLDTSATPGGRIEAAELFALADAAGFASPGVQPETIPGPRNFYAVADELLGARSRSHGVRFYTVPQPANAEEATVNDSTYNAIFERAAEILADRTEAYQNLFRSGDTVGALTLQRDSVDELAARREHRAS